MGAFSKGIENWGKKKMKKVKNLKKTYAFFLYSEVVKRTPVDTGRARANWNVSLGKMDTSTTESTDKRVNLSDIKESSGDESYYISNNLPYIKTLEYGGYPKDSKGSWDKKTKRRVKKSQNGYSKQAPKGMVGITVADADRIFNLAVRASRDE